MTDIASRADIALKRDLCDHCLGRIFALVGTGTTNEARGKSARAEASFEREGRGEALQPHEKCWLCEDIFDSLPRFAEAIIKSLSKIEYNNFLVGTRVDPEIQGREERLWSEVGQETAEPIKAELNREIGKIVEARIGKPVEFDTPEVVALIDTRFAQVDLDVSPLFIYGRYRKLVRDMPQTRWPCRQCRGKGCERCQFTGKMYPTSVQEIVGDPIMSVAEGTDHFFHGMGREDIDARMLGTGRPFVIEIREPKKRNLNLGSLENIINDNGRGRVEVVGLRSSSREEVRRVKASAPNKTYRVEVAVHGKVDKAKINEVLQSFKRTRITQQTPVRVAHRRADIAREREIIDLHLDELGENSITFVIRTEAGTYIKEFVHGDKGRTRPSLSEALGVPCEVRALDVIEVNDGTSEE
ncbi:MAG: tRNA pseudouridine(54/55) synthase Pus10 [Methanomassiliicoccales archaeon]|nr:tRNA pseudouridine(54/55) synthase Pus10 [Methanomassiliicoccales archaeon]